MTASEGATGVRKPRKLTWYDDENDKVGYPDCVECASKMFGEPGLIEACASVGIEHGKSTGLMLREFIDLYHERGHSDD